MTKEELEHSLDGLFRERLNLRVQAKRDSFRTAPGSFISGAISPGSKQN